jgi:hypothetical protein
MKLGHISRPSVQLSMMLAASLFAGTASGQRWSDNGGRLQSPRLSSGVFGLHTCQVKGDGTVRCWGSNDFGQLGNGPGGPGQISSTPVQVPPLGGAVAVAELRARFHHPGLRYLSGWP